MQADVYNALYEAHVRCDDIFEQSRSEFIAEMFDRYRSNKVTVDLLKILITHSIQNAKTAISEFRQNPEATGSPVSMAPYGSIEVCGKREKASRLVTTDDYLESKNRYVAIHECVIQEL